ncbi:MAG TPA: secretin N-terminal domain-containing protein, partial [Polyangiaceae bacterium]
MRHRLIFSFVAGWLALCQARSAGAQGAPPAPETPPAPAPPAPAEQPKPAPAEAPAPKKPGANLPGALGPGKRARPAQTVPAREPPGAAPAPPTTMDKIAQATDIEYKPMPPGQKVKFNLQDADLAELVNHISGMTGKRFIYGAKVRQIKATVVSPEPVTLEEAYQAFLSILEANGMTVVPHGRFLKIVDSGGVVSKATPVVPRGEPVPDTDRFITRLYRVQNITADEASTLLGKFKSKDGDISVYGPGQLLIITDTGAQVRRMMRIIEEIDVGASEGGGGGGGQHMWLEQVRHGTASDMAKRINDLFEVGQPGQAGAGGAGLSKVVADDQTNSLIVVGNEDSYKKLLELMKRLDTQPAESSRARVLPLQNAQADQLAATLTQMLQKGQGQPGAQGMFEGDIKVIPDPATNSLVISSSGRDYATLRLVVDKLDLPRRQVFIEAVIMDLSVSDRLDIGTSFHGGGRANLGGGGDSLILGGFNASKSVTFPDLSALQGLAAGIRGPDIPNTQGLLPTGLSIPAFGIVIQALATSGKSNILATPHIV